jgi:uncharacterized protein YggE
MNRTLLTIPKLAAIMTIVGLVATAPAFAQDEARIPFEATTLHLSASGEAHAAPDMADISVGVEVLAPTAAEALRQNAQQMTATIAALKAKGVEARDIQTSGLTLNPQYVFHDNEPRRLTGYQASNTVTILVRNLAQLGPDVDAVVAVGANRIGGVSFGLADRKAAEDAARRAAVKTLQEKASLLAEAAGYRVARLVSLTDGGGDGPPIRPMTMTRVKAPGAPPAPTPTEAGDVQVTATVSAVYELKK